MSELPIGLFDSGVGGLTVMKEIAALMPHENLIYLGDTARVPYGKKSPDAIQQFSIENANFLFSQNVKLIVIACHTASAHALNIVQASLPIPILGVTTPGCTSLLAETQTNRVAILATASTIASKIFDKLLKSQRPNIELYPVACPLFVPLVEEGLQDHESTLLLAEHYLGHLRAKQIDAALLACTHYPLLRCSIQRTLPGVALIEPAKACARTVQQFLQEHNLLNTNNKSPQYQFFASDDPAKFAVGAKKFFPSSVATVFSLESCSQILLPSRQLCEGRNRNDSEETHFAH